MHRFLDTPTYWSKIAKFFHPPLYSAPPSGVKLSELSNDPRRRKTRMIRLSGGKRILTKYLAILTQSTCVTHRKTHEQREMP